MATLPTVPVFAQDDSSLANLQDLAYAAKFLSDADVKPVWHTYGTATQSISATTWAGINTSVVAVDSDNVNTSPGVTIVTQGYYAVEMCVPFQVGTTSIGVAICFEVTAGANNPNHASGTSQQFGYRGTSSTDESAVYTTLCSAALCPWVCYPGDQIIPMAYASSAVTLGYNTNTAYREGRFVRNFTGMWIREGT